MYYVIESDGTVAFEGMPADVENWLFENTPGHNSRLRVMMGSKIITAWQFLGWLNTAAR